MMDQIYEKIYDLRRRGMDVCVIREMFDEDGEIRSAFLDDRNHAWYIAGVSLYDLDDYFSALYCFKKSLRFCMHDDECMLAIGNCYDHLERADLAEKWFRKAEKAARNRESMDVAVYNLGNSLFDQGKYKDAAECYRRVSYRKDETGRLAKKNLKISKMKL